MKFIWHIIRKDILRDRWALLLWALLFVAQTGIGFVMLNKESADRETIPFVQLAAFVLVFLQFVMGYVLVARLVQADALVGTNMFWLTRPVSAARLLGAKALGALLIFGLSPVLLLLPWWLYCDFGWREIGWTAIETVGWQLLMIVPAFLVASLTDDLGRVLLWTLLLVIALVSWIVLLQTSFTAILGRDLSPGASGRVYTKLWLSALTFVVGGAVIAAHQYLTRRFVRSVVLAAAGLGLVALIGQVCPWNWAPAIGQLNQPEIPSAPPEVEEKITFEVLPAQDMTGFEAEAKPGLAARDTSLNLRMKVQGLPEDLQLGLDELEQTWTWPSGVRIAREGNYYDGYDLGYAKLRRQFSLPSPAADQETMQWEKSHREKLNARLKARSLLYRQRRPTVLNEGRLLQGYTSLPNSFVEKMRREPPAYAARFQGTLYRLDVMAELPLVVGARASYRAETFRVQDMNAGKPLVLVTHSTVSRLGLWYSLESGDGRNYWQNFDQAVALNRVTGDIGWVGENQSGSRFLVVGGVLLNWNLIQIGSRMVMRGGQNVGLAGLDPQWVEHTKLVFLFPTKVGRLTREVKAENYAVTQDYWEDPDSATQTPTRP
ncbi:MAG: hypothetical protein WDM96_12060 [Lacunisphaera sp.]